MELSLRRWRPGQLLASWGAYWAGLTAVGLGPAIVAGWRATRLPEGHGSIEAGFANGTLNYAVIEEGVKTFSATAQLSTAIVWVVGPPLLLWLIWLVVRRRPNDVARVAADARRDALGAGAGPAEDLGVKKRDRVPAERERRPTPNP